MKPIIFLIAVLFFHHTLFAQSKVNPGGISGALIWLKADDDHKGSSSLLAASIVNQAKKATLQMNFHPAFEIGPGNNLSLSLSNKSLAESTIFTVYHAADTSREQTVWHLDRNQNAEIVLTTDRLSDLDTYSYMNYRDVKRSVPKVNVYIQQKPKLSLLAGESVWHIGYRPSAPKLPISDFSGLIPELLIFDRMLVGHERLKVLSYLSLKYGITLVDQGLTYLSSKGDKIWEGSKYSEYHRNIAGIARDDSSGLKQNIATSANDPNTLTMESVDSLEDQVFVIWGDNGLPLTKVQGFSRTANFLEKKWLIVTSGTSKSLTARVLFNTEKIDAELPVKPTFWLAIDRSGTGKMRLASTDFVKMTSIDNYGIAKFDHVSVSATGVPRQSMAVVVGQELSAINEVSQTFCSDPQGGGLRMRILGGAPPFNVVLTDRKGYLLNTNVKEKDLFESTGLKAGKYYINVSDSRDGLFVDSFYLNSNDAPIPPALSQSYNLPPDEPLVIKLDQNIVGGIQYEWAGPAGRLSGPAFETNSPGKFLVTAVAPNGCTSQKEFLVLPRNVNHLEKNIRLYPNPSNGYFTATVQLPGAASIDFRIYDAAGRLIESEKREGFANYRFNRYLPASGSYKLVFTSGNSTATKSLIISK